jgi:hypothetical protein
VRIEYGRKIVAVRTALAGHLKARHLLVSAMDVQHLSSVRPDDARCAWLFDATNDGQAQPNKNHSA